MKKSFLFIAFASLCLLIPVSSEAEKKKRKRTFKRKWSLSVTNGYSFYRYKKGSSQASTDWGYLDGQMHLFFSSLDVSRNFGYYEVGAKIQNSGSTFISPFFTWNLNKNHSKASFVTSLTLGIVPAHLMGSWLRLNFSWYLNRYLSLSPFVGAYTWILVKNSADNSIKYEKYNIYSHAGLSIKLYY